MTGLSVGFAGRTGLFNIGASGQFTFGAYAAILVGVRCTFLPGATHWMAALLAAVIAGALWGLIPGLLKAFCNVNEVISCIMMNYIGMHLVNQLITLTCYDSLKNMTQRVAGSAMLPKSILSKIFPGSAVNIGILLAIAIAILMYIILEKTVFGYELKASGFNRDAAHYVGMNQHKGVVASMAMAGALAGLGGALAYLVSGKGISVVNVLAVEGFNGIPVALLGLNHPIGIVFSGIFIGLLTVGGLFMQLYDFKKEIIDIIVAIIIYFSAFSLLVKIIIQKLRRKRELTAEAAQEGVSDSAEKEGEEA
jgi:simple sugar transport system permease protein